MCIYIYAGRRCHNYSNWTSRIWARRHVVFHYTRIIIIMHYIFISLCNTKQDDCWTKNFSFGRIQFGCRAHSAHSWRFVLSFVAVFSSSSFSSSLALSIFSSVGFRLVSAYVCDRISPYHRCPGKIYILCKDYVCFVCFVRAIPCIESTQFSPKLSLSVVLYWQTEHRLAT